MKRLLSFLSLFIIGWGCAWGQTYPKTWDFTTSNNTDGLTITNTGKPANWVYVEGVGFTGQRGGNEAIITIPNVMYGNVITVDLSTGGSNPNNNNSTKYWEISCNGETLAFGNGGAVGTKTVSIPNTVTSLTNATISIRGYSDASWLVLSRIEVSRTPVTGFQFNGGGFGNLRTQLNDTGVGTIDWNSSDWRNNMRLATLTADGRISLELLCDGSMPSNISDYFTVTFSPELITTGLTNTKGTTDVPATSEGQFVRLTPINKVGCGTTTMTVKYLGSQQFEPFTKTYTITVNGTDQDLQLIWLSQTNSKTGSPQGGKYRGSYWTQQNINDWIQNTNQQSCTLEYGNEIIVNASVFNNLDWVPIYTQMLTIGYGDTEDRSYWFKKLKGGPNPVSGEIDPPTYWTGEEAGIGSKGFTWRYDLTSQNFVNGDEFKDFFNNNADKKQAILDMNFDMKSYIPNDAQISGNSNNAWMGNIQYSMSKPELIDEASKGMYKEDGMWKYSIRPYPNLDSNGEISSTDSTEIVATIPAPSPGLNPLVITTRVLVTKGSYNLGMDPDEGIVTDGAWVQPYVNVPDIKLKDINRIIVWIEDETIAQVAHVSEIYQDVVVENEDGTTTTIPNQKCYVIYDDDINDHNWIETKKKNETGNLLWLNKIFPKIFGHYQGNPTQTKIHITVESPYYDDARTMYTLNVIPDEKPAFHWTMNDYINEDKTNVHTINLGWDKGTNKAANPIEYGDDDGKIKEVKMFVGDYIYMPGIVGVANGNNEYSSAHKSGDGNDVGLKYAYGIKKGVIQMNWDPYYYGEGVPNYFFTDLQYSKNGDLYVPTATPMIPETYTQTTQPAIIFKELYSNENSRLDTLMIFANQAGSVYLWAQDAQTHKCCTPIKFTILPRETLDNEKASYLSNMTYPFTWDFEHMDMSLIEQDLDANNAENDNNKGNNGIYWEAHRENQNYYQANGFFNADHDDKDNNATDNQNDGGLRQRWFKDLSANGKYIPEFCGIMLNIAGLDYWDQKYNRFNVAKDGSHIYFTGGPHFISLPGFGINPTQRGTATGTSEDGTRNYNNLVQSTHNHINTTEYSAARGYDYVSNGAVINKYKTNYSTVDTYRNHKVRLVIKARGSRSSTSSNVNPNQNGSSSITVGGKTMLLAKLNQNRVEITNENKSSDGYTQFNINREKPDIYIFELDPYDPDMQDHIYVSFNNDVKVYWMAISTEARDLRSDYDNFSYSYPKDIDLDKSNILMKKATAIGIKAKQPGSSTTITGAYKVGQEIGINAYYAKEYRRAAESLTLEKVPNNRFAANEGVIIYPTTKISDFDANKSGMVTISRPDQTAYKWTGGYQTETVNSKDENGNSIQVTYTYPVCEATTIDKTFQYLPTYFIANAQNMADYENTYGVKDDTNPDYNYKYQYGKVPLLNKNEEPMAKEPDNDHTTKYNGQTNLLRPSVYTTFVRRDYNLTNGTETDVNDADDDNPYYESTDNRWVTLGMSNEFIWRNLLFSDEKTLRKSMVGSDGVFHDDDTYYMYGPEYVRFYRTNKDQNMKNRRAYLSLTWAEYNVDTYGKGGVDYQQGDKYSGEIIYVPGAQTGTGGTNGLPATGNEGGRYSPVVLSKGYSVRLNIADDVNDESVVSDDAGIVDGINTTETVESNEEYVFYNLKGIRVYRPSKGIYILNGKKVIVK